MKGLDELFGTGAYATNRQTGNQYGEDVGNAINKGANSDRRGDGNRGYGDGNRGSEEQLRQRVMELQGAFGLPETGYMDTDTRLGMNFDNLDSAQAQAWRDYQDMLRQGR